MEKVGDILIVDEVSDNIQVAIAILESEGYNFSYALSGHEAIEILKTKRFDLILLDIMMPIIDGFQLCKIIKNTRQLKDIPIIFLTEKVDMESVEEGFRLGAVDYITKPFHPRMKTHPEKGLDVLKRSSKDLFAAAAIIAHEHHENYDGTGYPRGLKGDEIHIYGRIVGIADVLDALLERHSYKQPWSFEEAAGFIISEKRKKFDPRLITLFEENLEVFKELAEGEMYC